MTNLPLIIINAENSLEPKTKITYINNQIIIINNNILILIKLLLLNLGVNLHLLFLKNHIKLNLTKNRKYWIFLENTKNGYY